MTATMISPAELPVRVAGWVRWAAVALAVPQLVTGLWAVLAPQHWYDTFPGFGPLLVASDPPFNAHLATDAGSGFLATGVILVLAAVWGERRVMQVALAGMVAFAAGHLWYHAAHPAPGLSDAENAVSVGSLVLALLIPIVLLVATRRPRGETR